MANDAGKAFLWENVLPSFIHNFHPEQNESTLVQQKGKLSVTQSLISSRFCHTRKFHFFAFICKSVKKVWKNYFSFEKNEM